ncbi:FAD-binding monooxygenase [Virgisporangium ochraceum]|uniref:FAD-binding monooxygenase n=1 Tax=Virgisporangium ochraceum TaxID=65505 RepID=A0A8J4A3C6_9ACTN|nr:FAD-dependent monooxygenase [Virgisporangium ochraceum]GIJ74058.1 FAD-binding monooxygenase [Virgisporangium ochraceum]
MVETTAVVIGASVGGLATARVLADRFDQVVVLERDLLPVDATARPGVPQGAHPHTMLVAGLNALEELFPGFEKGLEADGATVFEAGTNLTFYRFGERWPFVSTGVRLLCVSRPLLELTMRQRLAAAPNVEIRDETVVSGLACGGGRITGVVLASGETLPSDLVVDCTGRGTRSDRWLEALGFPTPTASEVKIGVSYASRTLRRNPGDLTEGGALYIVATPPHEKRVGLVLPLEGDRWLMALGGWHGEGPSADPDDFAEYARSLPHPPVADLLAKAEPLTDIEIQRFPSSRRRHFERLKRVPAGFAVVGDAFATFNPIYGQGMTAALLQAQALGAAIDRSGAASPAMAKRYFSAAAKIVSVPWRFATGADFLYPETTGAKPPGIDLLNRYSMRVQQAALRSTEVRRVFTSVQHLIAPASRLLTPAMVLKVLRASRRT